MVYRFRQIAKLLIISTTLLTISCNQTKSSKQEEKRNIPVSFNNGDVAFRRGIGAVSRVVLAANIRGSFSHVGVVVNVDGEWYVIHEVPYEGESRAQDKIYCEKIEEFFTPAKAESGAIYRYKDLDSLQRNQITNYLFKQLKDNTPFDHKYNLDNDKSQYCSELVWRSFLEVGIDISKGERTRINIPTLKGDYILPSDI